MRAPILLVVSLPLLTTGCYRTCGTVELYAVDSPEYGFDRDGDGDLDFIEACGIDAGSFGSYYPAYNLIHLLFDFNVAGAFDMSAEGEAITRYMPTASVWAPWTSFQEPGSVIDLDSPLVGEASLRQSGDPSELLTFFPLLEGRIEVVRAPKAIERDGIFAEDEPFKLRIAWDLTYGYDDITVSRYRGEDVVRVELDRIVYTDPDDFPFIPASP